MTLIIALITPSFSIHVSDRQLTDATTGRPIRVRAAKTVIVPAAQFMVSYTGIAQIRSQLTTEDWLARTLWETRSSADAFGALAEAATEAFATVAAAPSAKRHAFLVSGWIGSGSYWTDVPAPLGFDVSCYHALVVNYLDFEAGIELTDRTLAFVHRARPLYPNERFSIVTAGVGLTAAESAELDANVGAALRSRGGAERGAAMAMLRTVERVSRRTPLVGGGVFISSLPRNYSTPSDSEHDNAPELRVLGVRWGLPTRGAATFVHIPDGPTRAVESPTIIADPFAGRAEVIVRQGQVPDLTGVPGIPEAVEVRMHVLPLRSSDEIAETFGGEAAGPSSASIA